MQLILKKPIVLGGDMPTVTVLNFREEVVAGDMRGITIRDSMTFDEVVKIASRLTGQPDAVMAKLSVADLGEVVRIVGGFLNGGPETGAAPSP